MSDPNTYDMIVIGAGPAGVAAASTAALLGQRVAVVERNAHLGGAAVNTGTLPSKTMRETALALAGAKSRALYGVDLSLRRAVTIEDLLRHERDVTANEASRMHVQLERFNVTVVQGTGSFLDPHSVQVVHPTPPGGLTVLRGETIVIAIGSTPVRPPQFHFDHPRIHDSDELLDIRELPRSMAVIGAGVIGSEYACTFAVLGVEITVIDGRDHLLPFLDSDVSAALFEAMKNLNIKFHWNEKVESPTAPESGDIQLKLGSGAEISVDNVLVCAGRTSPTGTLNPGAAGLGLSSRGLIPADEHYRTSVPHIFAVGDVIGFPALASTSAEQGRVAACIACCSNIKTSMSGLLPAGIYTIPEIGTAGMTETAVREKGIDYIVGRADYDENPRGKIIGDKIGFLKLIFQRSDMKLLGVHVIGEQATELIHIGLMALTIGGGSQLFLDTCFNYPTLGDLYKMATFDALVKKFEEGKGVDESEHGGM